MDFRRDSYKDFLREFLDFLGRIPKRALKGNPKAFLEAFLKGLLEGFF